MWFYDQIVKAKFDYKTLYNKILLSSQPMQYILYKSHYAHRKYIMLQITLNIPDYYTYIAFCINFCMCI